MYIYIDIDTYICIHTYICTWSYVCVECVCACVCVHMRTRTARARYPPLLLDMPSWVLTGALRDSSELAGYSPVKGQSRGTPRGTHRAITSPDTNGVLMRGTRSL